MEKKNFFLQKEKREIPNGWNIYDLGLVFKVLYGKSKPKELGSIPVFGSQGVYAYTNRSLVHESALIIGRKGNAGSVYYVNIPCFVSDTAFFVVPKEEFKSRVCLKFVYYFLLLNKPKGDYAKTTLPSLSRKHLESLKIPLPPLSEQRAIAKVLKDFDDLIEIVEKQIENFERIKKGLMEKYFSEGVFEHKEFKETEVGRIPKEWEVKKLEELCYVNRYSVDPKKELFDREFLYVDIDSVEKETGKVKSPKRMKGKEAPSRARRLIKEGDVLFSTVRPYLKAFAIVNEDLDNQICSTGFAVLHPKNEDNLCNLFLLYVLFSDTFLDQCVKKMVGGQYPALNQSQVKDLQISLPPLPEQKEIANRLKAVDDLIETKREEKERLERAKKKVMELLLTGKVRVKSR